MKTQPTIRALFSLFVITLLGVAFTAHAQTTPTGTLTLSWGPNLTDAARPSYLRNALLGIENGVAVGAGIAAYSPLPEGHVADPADIIDFQNDRPRLSGGIRVIGDDIRAEKLRYEVIFSDGSPTHAGTFTRYTSTRYGLDYGPDGVKGTADDLSLTRITSGPASTLVDEIVYTGYSLTYPATTETEKEARRLKIVEDNLAITFKYFYDDVKIAEGTLRFTEPVVNSTPSPTITSFSASPSSIVAGQSTTLKWETENATEGVMITSIEGRLLANGETTVSPSVSTTYTITAENAGATASKPVFVNVTPVPPPPPVIPDPTITSFFALPAEIEIDDKVILEWVSEHGVSGVLAPEISTVGTSGSKEVSPQSTTTYSLSITGTNSVIVQASATVTVKPKKPSIIVSGRVTINSGESTTIGWVATDAATVVLDRKTEDGPEEVGLKSSTTVAPLETTVYTLIATGDGGTTSATVEVVVRPPPPLPPTITATVSPTKITEGESAEITWTTEHTTRVFSNPFIDRMGPSGTETVSPTKNTTYILTASGEGGSVEGRVTVIVIKVPPPPESDLRSAGTVSESGVVTTGKEVKLTGVVLNLGPDPFEGSITNTWQYRIEGTTNWVSWASAGEVSNLEVGEVKEVDVFTWTVGEETEERTYLFRLLSSTSKGMFASQGEIYTDPLPRNEPVQDDVALDDVIIGINGPFEPLSLLILPVNVPEGEFVLRHSTEPTDPETWTDVGTVNNLEGTFPVFLVPRGANDDMGFFRITAPIAQ